MARKGVAECSIEGCTNKELARGWCAMHYTRWSRGGEPGTAERRRGVNRTSPDQPCSVNGCVTAVHAHGMCPAHLSRWRKYGDPLGAAPTRPRKTLDELRREAFDGDPGGSTSPSGYRYRTLRRNERYAEHRLVMEHHLGRALYRDETVHHLNGDRSDNRIDNLELWSSWQPAGQRVEDKIQWAKQVLARYE